MIVFSTSNWVRGNCQIQVFVQFGECVSGQNETGPTDILEKCKNCRYTYKQHSSHTLTLRHDKCSVSVSTHSKVDRNELNGPVQEEEWEAELHLSRTLPTERWNGNSLESLKGQTDSWGKKENLKHAWFPTWGTWGRVLFPRARQRWWKGCRAGSLGLINGIFVTHLLKSVRPLRKHVS